MENGISTRRPGAKGSNSFPAPGQGDPRGRERYSFSVVEESLTTETIAEYRRSRTVPRRRGIRALLAAWLRRT
jgi:hypothetical protein